MQFHIFWHSKTIYRQGLITKYFVNKLYIYILSCSFPYTGWKWHFEWKTKMYFVFEKSKIYFILNAQNLCMLGQALLYKWADPLYLDPFPSQHLTIEAPESNLQNDIIKNNKRKKNPQNLRSMWYICWEYTTFKPKKEKVFIHIVPETKTNYIKGPLFFFCFSWAKKDHLCIILILFIN